MARNTRNCTASADGIDESLQAFATFASSNAGRTEVVGGAVNLLCRLLRCRRGGLLLLDPTSGLLRLEAPAFASDGSAGLVPRLEVAEDDRTLLGLQSDCPTVVAVDEDGADWLSVLGKTFGLHQIALVPVSGNGQVSALFVGEVDRIGLACGESARLRLSILSSLLTLCLQRMQLQDALTHEQSLVRVQKVFTCEAVDNRPLSQIVARLARESGMAVILEDRLLRPLAVSEPGIRGTESPASLTLPEGVKQIASFKSFLQQLIKTGAPAMPPSTVRGIPRRRLMVAVIGASRHLGFLSLVEVDRSPGDADRAVLSIGAGAVALKMLYEKIAHDVEENIKQDFLCNVVTNNYTAEPAIIEKANYLGYNINLPFRVIVMMWVNNKTGAAEAIPTPLITYAKQRVKSWSPRSIVSSFRNVQLFILADAEHETSPEMLAGKVLEAVSDQMPNAYYVGIGKAVTRPRDLKHSFEQAKETVGILQQMNRKNTIETYESLGAYSVLLGVKSIAELESFTAEILGRLLKHDSDKNVDLLHTLTLYIMEKGSHEEIAHKLHIHVNTLKYRLQKIQELLGVSLDDPEERFNVQLAIKALRVTKACHNWGS